MMKQFEKIYSSNLKISNRARRLGIKLNAYMENNENLIIPIWEYDDQNDNFLSVTVSSFSETEYLHKIVDGDEIVIHEPELIIEFGHNIKGRIRKVFQKEKGFSRLDILEGIYKGYTEIYAQNDPSVFEWPDYVRPLSELFLEDIIYNIKEKFLYAITGT